MQIKFLKTRQRVSMNIDSKILHFHPENEEYPFKFNPKACEGCGGKCCTGDGGYVFISVAEIQRIATFLKMRLDDFTRAYVRKVGYQFSLIEKPDTQHFGSHSCVFLRDGRCRIYPVRPKQCRTFPFWEAHKNIDGNALRVLQYECKGIIRKNKKDNL